MSEQASGIISAILRRAAQGKRTVLPNLNPVVTVKPFLCRQMTAVTDRKGGIHENTTVLQKGIR